MNDHEKMEQLLRIQDQAPIRLEPTKAALIVVDVQRWFTEPEHPLAQVIEKLVPGTTDDYFDRVRSTVLPNIKRLQQAFRSLGCPVIFLGVGCYQQDGQDLPHWMKDFDQLGMSLLGRRVCPPVNDSTWQIDSHVAPLPGEVVLNKASSGALASTRLDQMLHNLGINSLVVCGLTTAICVTQTSREMADRSFRVVVAEDACTEMSPQMHRAALLAFAYAFGRVQTTEEVMHLFATASVPV
jgi:nicotinamidase-related amidase